MRILVKANQSYHSFIWPHAAAGDTRWIDENILGMLNRDGGSGMFSVLKVETPDVTIDLEAHSGPHKAPPPVEEVAPPEVKPKRKPGRPKKVKDG